jgi:hypothetical protein
MHWNLIFTVGFHREKDNREKDKPKHLTLGIGQLAMIQLGTLSNATTFPESHSIGRKWAKTCWVDQRRDRMRGRFLDVSVG